MSDSHPFSPFKSGELGIVEWLERVCPAGIGPWSLGVGDDAAILQPKADHELVFTTDMVLEDACFRLIEAGPRLVGRKALAVNLSDLAAMAAEPVGCLVSLALPKSASQNVAREIMAGILELAEQHHCPVVGGDTNTWRGPLAVGITAIGQARAGNSKRRDGAKSGDWIMVTGPLGGSILGHHVEFEPRLDAARVLCDYSIHALIDISDGLSLDLWRICRASQCGAILNARAIPVAPAAYREADLQRAGVKAGTPLEHALCDGEDFELLFAIEPEEGARLLRHWPETMAKPILIGECIAEPGLFLREGTTTLPFQPRGWEHGFETNAQSADISRKSIE